LPFDVGAFTELARVIANDGETALLAWVDYALFTLMLPVGGFRVLG